MSRRYILLTYVAVILASAATSAHAQLLTCPPSNPESTNLRIYVQRFVSWTDPTSVALRSRFGVPVMDTAQVVVETNDSTCTSFTRALTAELSPNAPIASYTVIRFGGFYATILGTHTSQGPSMIFMLDSTFAYKGAMTY